MPKRWVQFALGLSLFVVVVVAASAFMDEPLRAYVEQRMNRSLKGYAVRIGVLDFHPIGFSVDLEDVEVVRTDEPRSSDGHDSTLDREAPLEGVAFRACRE